jgi:hypothetical protein
MAKRNRMDRQRESLAVHEPESGEHQAGPSDALALAGPTEIEPAPELEAEAPRSLEAPQAGPEEPDGAELAEPEEFLFQCPGCPMVWSSEVYSNRDQAEGAYKSHVYRHAHARPHESAPGSRFTRHP